MRAWTRKHLNNMVVAGIVAALVAGAPAVAASVVDYARTAGDSGRVDGISASRTPRAGQLLALNGLKKFPASVVPAGATGPAGPVGATGAAGPAGAAGSAGSPGAKGETGAAGAKGDTGAPGSAGPQGPAGAQGADGAQGPQGAKGDKGDTGATGATGLKGDKGDTGATGATGLKGDKGDTGAAGTPGAKGDKGDPGAPGADGAQGATGLKGDKGDTGATGATGPKGDKGDTGAAGTPGVKGDKGDKGDPGSAAAYPPIVDVNPILRPSHANLWSKSQINGNSWFNGYRSSFPDGSEQSYLEWEIPLQAGSWTIDVVYVKSHDAGMLSLSLDGQSVGPAIDAFRAQDDGVQYNQVETFSDVVVAASEIHTLRIATPTKNAASDGYFGYLTWIRLVRQ